MQRTILVRSGLDVPVFVVGTAPIAELSIAEGTHLLRRAFELGATWWDTSEDYGSYPHIASALFGLPRAHLTISTKTDSITHKDGHAAIQAALDQFSTDYIDIFFLHAVPGIEEFHQRHGCLHALIEAKQRGIIKAIGLSSHYPEVIKYAAAQPEIDVIMAPWNIRGQMPVPGTLYPMEHAITSCHQARKGVVLMKVLADGALFAICDEAIRAAAHFPAHHAINIGVRTLHELEADIRLVLGQPVDAAVIKRLRAGERWGMAA